MVDKIPFTKKGHGELVEELAKLKKTDRPKIIEDIAEARAHGDLSENAEYHAAKEKQSFIEARIALLDGHLSRANVIDFSNEQSELVKFGAVVKLSDEDTGKEKTFQIVGDLEAAIEHGKISISSPIAKALLGKRVDDFVSIKAPKGIVEYVILEVSY